MSDIDLYYMPASPACRSVLMLAKHLNISVKLNVVTLNLKEHLKPEFLAMNPLHTVPVIVDHNNNDYTLWESKAILGYLVDRYSPGNNVYPQDAAKRAEIDKWLFFDTGSLFASIKPWTRPSIHFGGPLDPVKETVVLEKLQEMETVMKKQGTKYLAGDHITLADLTVVASISHAVTLTHLDLSMYPLINNWFNLIKKDLPCYDEVNEKALNDFKSLVDQQRASYSSKK